MQIFQEIFNYVSHDSTGASQLGLIILGVIISSLILTARDGFR